MGRYRFHEHDDLMTFRRRTYNNLLVDERLGYELLAAQDRRTLKRIDRELRKRKRRTPEESK